MEKKQRKIESSHRQLSTIAGTGSGIVKDSATVLSSGQHDAQ